MESAERISQELAEEITKYTISPNQTQHSQIKHRLSLLTAWFGSIDDALTQLEGKTVLEIGCGQGDMTAVLARFVSDSIKQPDSLKGRVLAVDPAPPDYGAPYTLEQAQGHLSSSSPVGGVIEWVRDQPIEFLNKLLRYETETKGCKVDFVVLAHCLFYFESHDYLGQLLRQLHMLTRVNPDVGLLIADWDFQLPLSNSILPHYLAIEAQRLHPLAEGNIQTVFSSTEILAAAEEAGWKLRSESLVQSPDVEDGTWEIFAAREVGRISDISIPAKSVLQRMESAVEDINGVQNARCLNVWSGTFQC